jgi:hypothetical protein
MPLEHAFEDVGNFLTKPLQSLHGWSLLDVGLVGGLLYIGGKLVMKGIGSIASSTRSRVKEVMSF